MLGEFVVKDCLEGGDDAYPAYVEKLWNTIRMIHSSICVSDLRELLADSPLCMKCDEITDGDYIVDSIVMSG